MCVRDFSFLREYTWWSVKNYVDFRFGYSCSCCCTPYTIIIPPRPTTLCVYVSCITHLPAYMFLITHELCISISVVIVVIYLLFVFLYFYHRSAAQEEMSNGKTSLQFIFIIFLLIYYCCLFYLSTLLSLALLSLYTYMLPLLFIKQLFNYSQCCHRFENVTSPLHGQIK